MLIIKRIWRILRISLAKIIARVVYNKEYIKGRYFENDNDQGWLWILNNFLFQTIFFFNKGVPWPVSPRVTVANYKNIKFEPNDLHIFQTSGTYFQAIDGKITIGKGTWIAPNVGLITTNHDSNDPEKHIEGKDIVLGEKCWIGMNAVILPGVILGPHTVVGAGAVVTRSFPMGHCVLVGVPAKKIKDLNKRIFTEELQNAE